MNIQIPFKNFYAAYLATKCKANIGNIPGILLDFSRAEDQRFYLIGSDAYLLYAKKFSLDFEHGKDVITEDKKYISISLNDLDQFFKLVFKKKIKPKKRIVNLSVSLSDASPVNAIRLSIDGFAHFDYILGNCPDNSKLISWKNSTPFFFREDHSKDESNIGSIGFSIKLLNKMKMVLRYLNYDAFRLYLGGHDREACLVKPAKSDDSELFLIMPFNVTIDPNIRNGEFAENFLKTSIINTL